MDLSAGPALTLQHAAGLLAAVVLGSLVGLERQWHKHPAGLHTNALVALGASAYMLVALLIGEPTGLARVAGQVVTGIGFLCAGLIWHEGGSIRGINTAATVWCSCAIGVLCGLGMILWGGFIAVLVVVTNLILHYLERRFWNVPD